MPITAGTFLIGWLAIAGVLPSAGFWSKDEILAEPFGGARARSSTSSASSPRCSRVLHDPPDHARVLRRRALERRSRRVQGRRRARPRSRRRRSTLPPTTVEPHESPWLMTLPLAVLAGAGGGRRRHQRAVARRFDYPLERFLEPVIEAGSPLHLARRRLDEGRSSRRHRHGCRARRHRRRPARSWRRRADQPGARTRGAPQGLLRRHGVGRVLRRPGPRARRARRPSRPRASTAPSTGSPRSCARGATLRKLQTGYVRNYALGLTAGVVLLLAYVIIQLRDLTVGFPYLSALVARSPPSGARRRARSPRPAGGDPVPRPSARRSSSPRSASTSPSSSTSGDAGFQFVEPRPGSRSLGISWNLGVDGISLWLVVLTGVLFPIA